MERKKWVEIPSGPPQPQIATKAEIYFEVDGKERKALLNLPRRYQSTSTLPAQTVSKPADKYIARLCSFKATQPANALPTYALPALFAASVYAFQPASALPAYVWPALLAGKYLRDPAGKYIACLPFARKYLPALF